MIFHICRRAAWEDALTRGNYEGDTLSSEGFIHCSTDEQVGEVADARFASTPGLVLLVIDPLKVGPAIRYEEAANAKRYPHIYGPLNVDAVSAVLDFSPQEDGKFRLPEL